MKTRTKTQVGFYDINDYGDCNGAPWNDYNGAYDEPDIEDEEYENDEWEDEEEQK